MSRANLPAAPTQWQPVASTTGVTYMTGLTIREYFAGLAMQGIQCQYTRQDGYDPANLARHAVIQADELIAALAKVTP